MMSFERVIDLGALRECLATGTGKGVRIGVLDTGVDSEHPELRGRIRSNYEVVMKGSRAVVEQVSRGEDNVDHGTACAWIIGELAPDAEIHNVRVIGRSMRDTSKKLLAGLSFAIDEGWDILNLSLGTEAADSELQKLADKAYYRGVLMIAARDNRRTQVGFPAAYPSVLAVDMEYFKEPLSFHYHYDRVTELDASGVYIEAPSAGGGRQSFTGTSFACPHVSGIAARIVERFPGITPFQLRTALAALRGNGSGSASGPQV